MKNVHYEERGSKAVLESDRDGKRKASEAVVELDT